MCTVFIKDINKAIQFEITSFQEVQQQLNFICLEYNKGMLYRHAFYYIQYVGLRCKIQHLLLSVVRSPQCLVVCKVLDQCLQA